jgi:hypothetical protein
LVGFDFKSPKWYTHKCTNKQTNKNKQTEYEPKKQKNKIKRQKIKIKNKQDLCAANPIKLNLNVEMIKYIIANKHTLHEYID